MKIISNTIGFLWKIWFMIYMTISTFLFYPFLFLFIIVLKNYEITFKLYRIWAWSILMAMGIIPKLIGKENIPSGRGFIIISNHTSQLDIILPYALINQHYAMLAKKELEKTPLFNINFKGMNVTVDRRSMASGVASFKECNDKLKNNIGLLIFPEGTRSKNAPQMKPFKSGAFLLAIENQVDILPLALLDNYKRFGAGYSLFGGGAGPGIGRAHALTPISTKGMTKDDLQELKDKAFQAIDEVINPS